MRTPGAIGFERRLHIVRRLRHRGLSFGRRQCAAGNRQCNRGYRKRKGGQ